MHKPFLFKLFLISIFIGCLIFFRPIFLFFFILIASLGIFLFNIPSQERRSLFLVISVAALMRFLFSGLALLYVCFNYLEAKEYPVLYKVMGTNLNIVRDYHREILNGMTTTRFFQDEVGKEMSLSEFQKILNNYHFVKKANLLFFIHAGTYSQGILNFFFNSPLLNIFIYSLISLWICILIYYLTKELFNNKVALYSSAFIAVMPTFVFWSCINIRMSLAMIAMLLSAWSLIKFSKKNHIKYIGTLLFAMFLFYLGKERFVVPLGLISFSLLFFSLHVNRFIKYMCIGLLIIFSFHHYPRLQLKAHSLVSEMVSNHIGFHSSYLKSEQNYKIYDDKFYISLNDFKPSFKTMITALPKGMTYFLFSPFSFDNTSKLFFFPLLMITYFSFALAILGFFLGFRYKFKETGVIFLFSFLWILLLSLTIGNIGAAIRHRDLILPFYYMFAIAAICHMLKFFHFEKNKSV